MNRPTLPLLLALAACNGGDPVEEPEPLDLTERLPSGEVRAGVVTDEAALFGGIASEGRVGDVKIYNDRVQFVIQSPRTGSYYVDQGGGVIDADIVRPEGQLGRDAVEEWMGMWGLGRLTQPDSVVVEADGADGVARVVVEGRESPMALLPGILEAPGLIRDLGLTFRTEYVLEPDSWLLEVRTTVTATDGDASFAPGDVVLGALEVVEPWEPTVGREAPATEDLLWKGYAGLESQVGFGLVAAPGERVGDGGLAVVSEAAGLAGGFGESVTLTEGETLEYVRFYGVAPDLATLSDAALALHGVDTEPVDGVVTAPDGPVAGARVNVLVDDAPFTVAFTGADGAFSAQVPAGADVSYLVDGRGTGLYADLPDGAARYSPYGAVAVHERALASLRDGGTPVPVARGRGLSGDDPLSLGEPGDVVVSVADGLPFTVRFDAVEPDAAADPRLVRPRPSGHAAVAWSRDGEVRVPLEPGTYDVVVHRGIRYEAHTEQITVSAGGEAQVSATLERAYEHEGWMLGDPHTHAAPSNDGKVPMEDRLVVMAGSGVQLHFGTDHDHAADYRPMLAPLGLDTVLRSVVADEVSPVTRGHHNIYPLEHVRDAQNGGAWAWWHDLPPETADLHAGIRERHGHDVVIQANHPMSSGLASSADWSPGHIGEPSRWGDDIDAIEVANGGRADAVDFYWDMLLRGHLVTPVSVTDSHSHLQNDPGLNATFFALGSDDPADYSDDALRETMRARATVATRGPFLSTSIQPGSVVEGQAELAVTSHAPSWVKVDKLELYRDGVVVDTIEGTSGTFDLQADADAAFVVVATGATSMAPVYPGRTPWALTSAILLDVDGDGWDAPLPPFEME